MAYRITPTTEADRALMNQIREVAWRERKEVSEVMREAFTARVAASEGVPA